MFDVQLLILGELAFTSYTTSPITFNQPYKHTYSVLIHKYIYSNTFSRDLTLESKRCLKILRRPMENARRT